MIQFLGQKQKSGFHSHLYRRNSTYIVSTILCINIVYLSETPPKHPISWNAFFRLLRAAYQILFRAPSGWQSSTYNTRLPRNNVSRNNTSLYAEIVLNTTIPLVKHLIIYTTNTWHSGMSPGLIKRLKVNTTLYNLLCLISDNLGCRNRILNVYINLFKNVLKLFLMCIYLNLKWYTTIIQSFSYILFIYNDLKHI
jgi:hypothetical protein